MRRVLLPLLVALAVLAPVLVAGPSSAVAAAPTSGAASPMTTVAAVATVTRSSWSTSFTAAWKPYGNCGVPIAQLDTQSYAALNLNSSSGGMGQYANGKNCGRMITVKVGEVCVGGRHNTGAVGTGFCVGGKLVKDKYYGATQTFVIADSCPDANNWCRNDAYHLDLAKPALGKFVKNGTVMSGLSAAWANRKVTWSFVSAPKYTGDLKIGFRRDSQKYWTSVLLTHLQNGVGGVQYQQNGRWVSAKISGKVGQAYELGATVLHGNKFRIRVTDAVGKPVKGGASYNFSFPASCKAKCTAAYTPVSYTR
jgi:expansin (peptidoglycan-binding protein)